MTDAGRSHEKAVLDRLADIRDRRDGDIWSLDAEGADMRIVVRRSTGEEAHICTIHAAALADERDLLCSALDHLRLFLGLFARASARVRGLAAEIERLTRRAERKSGAQRAAILIGEGPFRRFLETCGAGGPVRDAQAADTRLKGVLAIQSKKDIDTDSRARTAFDALLRDFYRWKKGGAA